MLDGTKMLTRLQEVWKGGFGLSVCAVLRLDDDPWHKFAIRVGGVTDGVGTHFGVSKFAFELDHSIARRLQNEADLPA